MSDDKGNQVSAPFHVSNFQFQWRRLPAQHLSSAAPVILRNRSDRRRAVSPALRTHVVSAEVQPLHGYCNDRHRKRLLLYGVFLSLPPPVYRTPRPRTIQHGNRWNWRTSLVDGGSWSEQLGYWEVSHFRILGGKGAQDRERGAGMRGVPKRVRRRRNAAFAPQVQSRVSLRLYRSLVGLSRHLSGLSGQPYSQTRWKILRSSTHFWAGNWIRWIGHQSRDRWGAKPSSDCRGRAVPRCNESLECSRVRTPRVIRWFNRVRIARGRVFNILLLEQGEPWKRQQISFDRRP